MGQLSIGYAIGRVCAGPPVAPRPVLDTPPSVTGAPMELGVLSADLSDTWRFAGQPGSVSAREYRLLVGGAVVAGPGGASSMTLPGGTSGQSYRFELRATLSEASGVWSNWISIASGLIGGELELNQTAQGEVEIDHASGLVTVTITSPASYASHDTGHGAGVFLFDSAHLASGPVNLAPPKITGTGPLAEGETLAVIPGLWVYDPGVGGLGAARYQWQADTGGDGAFSDIGGATGNSHILTASEVGDDLRVRETLSDAAGSRMVNSAVLSATETSVPSGSQSIFGYQIPASPPTAFGETMLTEAEASLQDTGKLVIQSNDPAFSVVDGMLVADGTNTSNRNIRQNAGVASVAGNYYSVICEVLAQGGTGPLNSTSLLANGTSTSRSDAPANWQSVYRGDGDDVEMGLGFGSGETGTLAAIRMYDLDVLTSRPQAIFLVVGQSNWIGDEAGYTRDLHPPVEGCLVIPGADHRPKGADSDGNGPIPMMCMEPIQHQTSVSGSGPGAAFCREIRKYIPGDQTVCYLASGRAASGISDGDFWDTGGAARNGFWSLARGLWTRAQTWNAGSYIAGVIVCIGESDTGEIPQHMDNLSAFLDEIRAEPGWGEMPVVFAEIGLDPGQNPNVATMISEHRKFATGSGDPTYEKTRCSYVSRPPGWTLTDGTHYDQATNLQRGKDVGQAMASLIYPAPSVSTGVQVSLIGTETSLVGENVSWDVDITGYKAGDRLLIVHGGGQLDEQDVNGTPYVNDDAACVLYETTNPGRRWSAYEHVLTAQDIADGPTLTLSVAGWAGLRYIFHTFGLRNGAVTAYDYANHRGAPSGDLQLQLTPSGSDNAIIVVTDQYNGTDTIDDGAGGNRISYDQGDPTLGVFLNGSHHASTGRVFEGQSGLFTLNVSTALADPAGRDWSSIMILVE